MYSVDSVVSALCVCLGKKTSWTGEGWFGSGRTHMNTPQLDTRISKICGNAIVVSGSARSGTTIMGKILHSLEGVEYSFEPPMLFSLFALMEKIDCSAWRLLYETYLYEEFFINALSGRHLNCNRGDDSSIFAVKSMSEVDKRLACSIGKSEAEKIAANSVLAYKMPDVVPFLSLLKQYYPQTRLVMMRRNAIDTFHSIKCKGWFSDAMLRNENLNWPNTFINGLRVPFWVKPQDHEKWAAMDELHRIAYYYLQTNGDISVLKPSLVIDYDEFVTAPHETVTTLAKTLGLQFGAKTEEVLATVSKTDKERPASLLDGLEPLVKAQVEKYSSSQHIRL